MKNIKQWAITITAILSFAVAGCSAVIKNAKTVQAKVSGNCEMCKERIDAAATKKGISTASWNVDSKLLTFTFDSLRITPDELLKQVADAGHDNEKFMAPDETYSNLPGCCQYERKKEAKATDHDTKISAPAIVSTENTNPVSEVETAYFGLKDALTQDDPNAASEKAKELFKAIDNVKMEKMPADQHKVWMALKDKLSYDAEHIKGTTELEHQREHFISLSKNMYQLIKTFKMEEPVYYQHCPMANDGKGADWLSLQEKINNPYFGKSMSTCGKTTEIIKK